MVLRDLRLSKSEVRRFSILLSGHPLEDVASHPVGKQKATSVQPVEGQGSQWGWVSLAHLVAFQSLCWESTFSRNIQEVCRTSSPLSSPKHWPTKTAVESEGKRGLLASQRDLGCLWGFMSTSGFHAQGKRWVPMFAGECSGSDAVKATLDATQPKHCFRRSPAACRHCPEWGQLRKGQTGDRSRDKGIGMGTGTCLSSLPHPTSSSRHNH